jgi:hypothetical protein
MGAVAWAMRQRSVSHPRSSNRTCRFPASGSPTGFTVRHTARGTKVGVRGATRRISHTQHCRRTDELIIPRVSCRAAECCAAGRRKADALGTFTDTVAHTRATHDNRADPGHDLALRQISMAHQSRHGLACAKSKRAPSPHGFGAACGTRSTPLTTCL